ncbi:GntR family transcriptional regulator [Streptomyces sp. NBC_01016]|uniref:GntR family transcriptional regulator n=1 Tax=Streptomyces sp. NBC_01016 TaxID=2903720 RepID=UPI00225AC6CD|nr:GntR family transcriptional regulator [Streptomyces sp. NBC_01016]MCX4831144.1 GntR family transcriptional regulator [Streptomyces sp. NBC_01016]
MPTSPTPGPLARVPLHEQVRHFILEGLVEGRWGPGDRIVERRITLELGVSQAPAREALRELEAMELVTYAPNKGASVRELTLDQLRDVYQVRASLERRAITLAASRMAGDVTELERHLAAMRRAAVERKSHEQALQGVAFHRAIVHACGNPVLIRHWDLLGVEAWTRLSLGRLRTELHDNAEDHEEIVEGLRRGDPHLGRLMELHVMDYARK